MESEDNLQHERFSLVVGGPFHTILRKLGFVSSDELPSQKASASLVFLAWLPLALLVVAQSLVDNNYSGWGFFTDLTVYTRYVIAIWVMITIERYADKRLILLTQQFREARILPKESRPAFSAAVIRADQRSSSRVAEFIVVGIALVWASFSVNYFVEISVTSWDGSLEAGEPVLSWAGQYARLISAPLFLFLVLRWFWRFIVWTVLLFDISRLKLRLSPLHPDRAAGLGFMEIYPSIFSGFVFALSCVIASAMIKELGFVEHSLQEIGFMIAGWIAIILKPPSKNMRG